MLASYITVYTPAAYYIWYMLYIRTYICGCLYTTKIGNAHLSQGPFSSVTLIQVVDNDVVYWARHFCVLGYLEVEGIDRQLTLIMRGCLYVMLIIAIQDDSSLLTLARNTYKIPYVALHEGRQSLPKCLVLLQICLARTVASANWDCVGST